MYSEWQSVMAFLEGIHPYDSLPRNDLARVARSFRCKDYAQSDVIYSYGQMLDGLCVIARGGVEVSDAHGALVSVLGARNSFGERGLMRDGRAATTAIAQAPCTILTLPAQDFQNLLAHAPAFARFFNRASSARPRQHQDLATMQLAELVTRDPVSCSPDTCVRHAARLMRDHQISSLGITNAEGTLLGVVTQRDMSNKVVAGEVSATSAVADVMSPDPFSLPPQALGSDVLHMMVENRVGHVPVTQAGRFVGMITQTDLTRFQALSAVTLIHEIARAQTVEQMAAITARIPQLLVQLVGANHAHEVTTRLITDIADAVTRRLVALAQEALGAAPVGWLWLACGSQGRQEQTGVCDQDNCLMVDDTATADDMGYFRQLAQIVSDGLNACGYVYCPGDMMATNPRWCQPVQVWRKYFRGWIAIPNPEAQMLASVMFDLRIIAGDSPGLFTELQNETLDYAARNSIFVAHMISNSLKHTPPLGLLRGFATIRSGEHRNHIDLKHNGVVPVADLARLYALRGQVRVVNTRARLHGAQEAGVLSATGARDLIAAYDLVARTRLQAQAEDIRAGRAPDNYLAPSDLSDFARSHLRDAFVVVRSMQSSVGYGKAGVG